MKRKSLLDAALLFTRPRLPQRGQPLIARGDGFAEPLVDDMPLNRAPTGRPKNEVHSSNIARSMNVGLVRPVGASFGCGGGVYQGLRYASPLAIDGGPVGVR